MRRLNGLGRWLIIGGAVALIAGSIAAAVMLRPTESTVDLTQVIARIPAGEVSSVNLASDGRSADVTFTDNTTSKLALPEGQSFTELLAQAGVPFEQWPAVNVGDAGGGADLTVLLRILAFVGVGVLLFFLVRRLAPGAFNRGGRRGAFEPVHSGIQPITFADVAGSSEVKEEVRDIVEYLREPDRFREVGAHVPRGVLLAGPPGTGKTLIARALAGEANAAFFSVSGSEFVELYVGVGASRVRELFRRAKEAAPAIIFIDEIDAIGRRRGRMEQSSEYDQTLNQILVEMDGFEERSTVIVVAATNRIDILDTALLRPGRFDRKIVVDLPDRVAREEILKVHARGKPLALNVVLDDIAARTTGMTGADLSNIINEAAILAARAHRSLITREDLFEALDRTMAGPARDSRRFTETERRVVAYHEAGHAVVAHLLPNADTVQKVSIVSRGRAGGYTMIVPDEDRGLWTRAQLNDRLAALLGGRVAEEIIFGDVTTGSSNDLEQVTSIASSMVQRYGMSKRFGLLSVGAVGLESGQFSQQTAFTAEQEALEIVARAQQTARAVLLQHRDDLERVAQRLLAVETIERDELAEIIQAREYVPAPVAPRRPVESPSHAAAPNPQTRRRRSARSGLRAAAVGIVAFARSVIVSLLARRQTGREPAPNGIARTKTRTS